VASAATRLARRLPFSYRRLFKSSFASDVTGVGDGCKPSLVADCGVYGLPALTSRQLAIRCAWPTCHRAFPPRPPEQPRHQAFRARGGEAWRPKCGGEAQLPQAAAPPIRWTQNRTAPTHRDRRSSPSSFSKPRKIWPPNGGFSRDALARRLPFSLPTFVLLQLASDVTGAKSAASIVSF
jgi:hypothetical protein